MKQMKNRKVMLGIIVLTAICGCRSVRTHESILKEQISGLDKLGNVMVITREDGSGTRSTFSQLTGFDEKNKETGASDLTRQESIAQIKTRYPYTMKEILEDEEKTEQLRQQYEEILSQYEERILFYRIKIEEMMGESHERLD